MEEITLAGGTLMGNPNAKPSLNTSSSAATATASNTSASGSPTKGKKTTSSLSEPHKHGHGHHSHSHSHHHQHHGKGCCDPSGQGVEMMGMQHQSPSLDDLLNSTPQELIQALSTLFRFGRFEAIQQLITQLKATKNNDTSYLALLDDGGHSLFHWASKRIDDIRLLQLLINETIDTKNTTELINRPSEDSVGMYPLHWACTEGSIPHVALLLQYKANIESRDKSGCTPLLIAAQYGQVEVVAYLLQKGANVQAVDTAWDTALHWAAYKGSIQVCGLLSYKQNLEWSTQDAYGQTPLHLASLRGHTSVVRYIMSTLSQHQSQKEHLLLLKDKNERTPLDLAIHKKRPNVEIVLREYMSQLQDPRAHFLKKTLFQNIKSVVSLKQWKIWLGCVSSAHDELDQPARVPYYFMIMNYMLHFYLMVTAIAPIFNVSKGLMWDKSGWLLWNFAITFLSWYSFVKTVKTKPGYLDDSCKSIEKWRNLYETTLESYANVDSKASKVLLCHTCHVARPLRSKHCRVNRKCTLMFDHFCPFVDNTIGLYNYRFFYMLLLCMTLALSSFVITLAMYVSRYRTANQREMPWMTLIIGVEICMCLIPMGGMFVYHTQLSMVNLTTNEHLNVRKYKYLHSGGKYKNPWFKNFWLNAMDRMYPNESCYILPSEYVVTNNNKKQEGEEEMKPMLGKGQQNV